jgi:hypothetical protein
MAHRRSMRAGAEKDEHEGAVDRARGAMSERGTRRLWFFGLWLLLPWPLLIFADGFVPAVRYVLLASAATAIAVFEGSSGPVALIVTLFVGMGLVTTVGCWLIAFVVAKLLARLTERTSMILTLSLLGTGLVIALFFAPYRTPFGRALRGGLLEVLS